MTGKEEEALAAAGLGSWKRLLEYFPKRYEDRRSFDAFPSQGGGGAVCLRGQVVDTRKRHLGGRAGYYEALVEEKGGLGFHQLSCRWFNMPFISKVLAAGQEVILYGKPKEQGGKVIIDHPEFEVVQEGEDGESIHLERLVPIYRNVPGLSQRKLRELIFRGLQEGRGRGGEVLSMDETYDRSEALNEVHFPDDLAQVEAARRYFAREEFFLQQLWVLRERQTYRALRGRVQGKKTALLKKFYESLPFDLTTAQKRSVREILMDMRAPEPMGRLLQGDVGSGKTFVALCAMVLAVDGGSQAALMAPTQILAEQHALTFRKWLEPLGVKVGLVTGNRVEDVEGADLLIGTHALLFGKVSFRDLSLVVIDEQHKFGVGQRDQLIQRGVMPDVLVMTATPIPRSLTLTIYGDMDVSVLDELPAGRGKIISGVRVKPKVRELSTFLKSQLQEGRQAYLVYPLVEESETVKAGAVLEECPKWVKRLKPFPVDLLHGKLSGEEKETVMERFRKGESGALVSTSVIEVGVDVPNATVMVIFNAERFGLAQLHQLRGRIGRGEHKSYCVLVSEGKSREGLEKLRILAGTLDGFRIAEEDLRLRGPGELMGTRQSGRGELKFPEFLADTELVREARELAAELLQRAPERVEAIWNTQCV